MVYSGEKGKVHKFVGHFEHNLDEKGRLIFPAKFRALLGEKFYICLSFSGDRIWAMPESEWNKLYDEYLSKIPPFDKEGQNFLSLFTSLSAESELDKQGRALIPENLREKINLEKETVLIGKLNFIEIYNKEKWTEIADGSELSKMAQEYFSKSSK